MPARRLWGVGVTWYAWLEQRDTTALTVGAPLVVATALPQARAPASCAAAALVGLLVAGLDSLLFLVDGQGNGASYVGIGEVGIEIEEEPRWT